jgi:Family of unknown function (DUF6152)
MAMKNIDRRHISLGFIAAIVTRPSLAHHGWSSFDDTRPIYLAGKASRVKWGNPHAEIILDVSPNLVLPIDLKTRAVPAQTAAVDGPALLAKTTLPKRTDPRWEIELAPVFRMDLWKIAEIKVGQSLEAVGFTFKDEKGDAIMRVEYLWIDGKTYGLRSSPAA